MAVLCVYHTRDMVTSTLSRRTRPPGSYIALGRRIKALRERRGLSQPALADLAGISPGYPPRIENGDNCPSPVVLKRIAAALDADYNELATLAGYIDEQEGDEMIKAPRGTAASIRRMLGYTTDQWERIERMARIMLLSSEPANETQDEGREHHDVEGETREQEP